MDGPIRILHVEDDPEFADVAATFLERVDDRFVVQTATEPRHALDRLGGTTIDCIISDYDMPDTNGIKFLEAVREEYPELPFILYTGKGSEEVASDAITAGVTDYLQKETSTEQYTVLANRIENAVEAYRSRQVLDERTRKLETLISNLPGIVYRSKNEPGWPLETVEGEAKALTGYTAETLKSDELVWGDDVLHPDDKADIWETVQADLEKTGEFEVTYRLITKDGETKRVWERGRGHYDSEDLTTVEGFITDITERDLPEL